jgi:hypothetical protein
MIIFEKTTGYCAELLAMDSPIYAYQCTLSLGDIAMGSVLILLFIGIIAMLVKVGWILIHD